MYGRNMKRPQKHWLLVITATALLLLTVAGIKWYRHDITRSIERAGLPEEIKYEQVNGSTSTPIPTKSPIKPLPTPTKSPLLAEVNLAVPFTPQAPHANWDDPYGEFCEEASVLMAMSYIKGEKIPNADVADAKLLAMKAFEDKKFGYYKDTTSAETATIIKEFYNYKKVELVQNPTVADIKSALSAGKLVIIPVAGRMLGNPYFTPPGPIYHMLVIKGYTNDGKFITNDPGTRHGADFLYSENTVMNALHDWPGNEQIEQGKKVIIVIG